MVLASFYVVFGWQLVAMVSPKSFPSLTLYSLLLLAFLVGFLLDILHRLRSGLFSVMKRIGSLPWTIDRTQNYLSLSREELVELQ
jgi:hypothetical protein